MVDFEARAVAADLLERFLLLELTNDELEDRWPPPSRDPALEQVRLAVWYSYDDLSTHRGPIAVIPLVRSCAAFLRTPLEYVDPAPKLWHRLLILPFDFLTLGYLSRLLWPEFLRPNWPFPP